MLLFKTENGVRRDLARRQEHNLRMAENEKERNLLKYESDVSTESAAAIRAIADQRNVELKNIRESARQEINDLDSQILNEAMKTSEQIVQLEKKAENEINQKLTILEKEKLTERMEWKRKAQEAEHSHVQNQQILKELCRNVDETEISECQKTKELQIKLVQEEAAKDEEYTVEFQNVEKQNMDKKKEAMEEKHQLAIRHNEEVDYQSINF
ncbi:hypothetical protein GCK72_008092 [Caenorhabditis remanei]|uniref:Uncharacterized protein n=1 Tax=Caenorhabditis remanei TaxID=31234 RepID=A0A6A5HIX6_CAERE|nr:hypothetical protein GCK72_008092 [Caenorhabditis remanei]KAF1768130.1 hypothetical protein GCK72_008092 [Caenorhabditis remanei]